MSCPQKNVTFQVLSKELGPDFSAGPVLGPFLLALNSYLLPPSRTPLKALCSQRISAC